MVTNDRNRVRHMLPYSKGQEMGKGICYLVRGQGTQCISLCAGRCYMFWLVLRPFNSIIQHIYIYFIGYKLSLQLSTNNVNSK